MTRLLTLDGHASRHPDGWEADLRAETPRRWLRVAAIYGPPPGSRNGFWLTRYGKLRGVNYRVTVSETPRPWRCLTLLAHTRPARRQVP